MQSVHKIRTYFNSNIKSNPNNDFPFHLLISVDLMNHSRILFYYYFIPFIIYFICNLI